MVAPYFRGVCPTIGNRLIIDVLSPFPPCLKWFHPSDSAIFSAESTWPAYDSWIPTTSALDSRITLTVWLRGWRPASPPLQTLKVITLKVISAKAAVRKHKLRNCKERVRNMDLRDEKTIKRSSGKITVDNQCSFSPRTFRAKDKFHTLAQYLFENLRRCLPEIQSVWKSPARW